MKSTLTTIHLGQSTDPKSDDAVWDIDSSAHLFVTGEQGSGKTQLLNTILQDRVNFPKDWDFCDLSPKQGLNYATPEIKASDWYKKNRIHNALSAHSFMGALVTQMNIRYDWMEKEKVTNYRDFPLFKMTSILVIVDDLHLYEKEDPAEDNPLYYNLRLLLRSGRAAGIHVAVSVPHGWQEDWTSQENCYKEVLQANCTSHVDLSKSETNEDVIHGRLTEYNKLEGDDISVATPTITDFTGGLLA